MRIEAALEQLIAGKDLRQEETGDLFRQMMSGNLGEAQMGALLIALRMKGETAEEVAGAARTMREFALGVEVDVPHLVDTCGTGGSGAKLFNVSTAAAFVAAAAGAHVAKHGNRKMTSQSGSADLLEAAGARIDLKPAQIARCIAELGLGFMFAPAHHGATRFAAPVRRELGVGTLMNVLGPLTNPAGAKRQLIGVFSAAWQRRLAEVAQLLGSERVLVVHALGLDEIALDGPTELCELNDGKIREYRIAPEEFGMRRQSAASLRADSAAASLKLVRAALTQPDCAAADIVALNAGAAIYAAGVAPSLADGVTLAQEAVASGLARQRFDDFARVTCRMQAA